MLTFRPAISTHLTRFGLAVGTLSGVAALSLGGQTAWADASCTSPNNGPTGPTASTFTYQCNGTYAGDWTNAYYVFYPTTGKQTALYSPDYSYDCTTGTWTQAEWDYDAASGAYIEHRVAASGPPNQPTNCATTDNNNSAGSSANTGLASTTPVTPTDKTPTSTTPDSSTSSPTQTQSNPTTPPPQPDQNPNNCPSPDTASATTNTDPTGTATNADSGTDLNNTLCSQSQSGDATVSRNGSAGDATSGDATAEVDVANLVQSLSNTLGAGTATFTTNINGNVNGDLVLDPSTILADASGSDNQTGNAIGNVNTNANINNAIVATAVSGDTTVSGNGEGGNATSGNAEAIVNLINMINSAVAAGKSFIGTININGDLNGNILIPQSVIDELLGTNASNPISNGAGGVTSNNESITNNITASAMSGDATVANNINGGNATSGNANTNVTLLNLTGSSIIGKNVLLVFVNVLGQWVGMIVNAPTGATSAEFGGGITSDTPTVANNGGIVAADAQLGITNNVDVRAQSGNALVADNGTAGNATSGNADTLVNILNMENSDLSLANWFGILFIDVFGTWDGNFGILPTPAATAPSGDHNNGSSQTSVRLSPYRPFRHFASFVSSGYPATTGSNIDISNPSSSSDPTAILGDATIYPSADKLDKVASSATTPNTSSDKYILPSLGVLTAAVLLGFSERDRFKSHKD